MTDILVQWDSENAHGDWNVANGDLATCAGLESMVAVCLFTDRAAPASYVFPDPNDTDPRGWWGDTFEDAPTGSWLWLLNRAFIDDPRQFLLQVQDYASQSLQPLIDCGVAETITVNTYYLTPDAVAIAVSIIAPGRLAPQAFTYAWAWRGIG